MDAPGGELGGGREPMFRKRLEISVAVSVLGPSFWRLWLEAGASVMGGTAATKGGSGTNREDGLTMCAKLVCLSDKTHQMKLTALRAGIRLGSGHTGDKSDVSGFPHWGESSRECTLQGTP